MNLRYLSCLFFFLITKNLSSTPCDHALNLPGSNAYVDCGAGINLHPENGLTVEAWVRIVDPSRNQKVAGNIDPFTASGYELGVDSNHLYCEVKDTNGVLHDFRAGNINANEWTHLAFSYNLSGSMIGYINGVEVISLVTTSTPIGNTGTTDFIIGAAPWDQNYFVLNGDVDEVRVYNYRRSVSEIRRDMRMVIPVTSNGLLGYWRFTEGTGFSTMDNSGSGNTGTLDGITLPAWVDSDGPFGQGFSDLEQITCCNTFSFDSVQTHFTIEVNNLPGTDTTVVSYIQCDPGAVSPTGVTSLVPGYWVIDNYGPFPFNGNYRFNLGPGQISTLDETFPNNLKLFHRAANSTSSWILLDSASAATSTNGDVVFNSNVATGQFTIGTTGNSPLNVSSFSDEMNKISIFPNPVHGEATVVYAGPENQHASIIVSDMLGRIIQEFTEIISAHSFSINLSGIVPGIYSVVLRTGRENFNARIVVQ